MFLNEKLFFSIITDTYGEKGTEGTVAENTHTHTEKEIKIIIR